MELVSSETDLFSLDRNLFILCLDSIFYYLSCSFPESLKTEP